MPRFRVTLCHVRYAHVECEADDAKHAARIAEGRELTLSGPETHLAMKSEPFASRVEQARFHGPDQPVEWIERPI